VPRDARSDLLLSVPEIVLSSCVGWHPALVWHRRISRVRDQVISAERGDSCTASVINSENIILHHSFCIYKYPK